MLATCPRIFTEDAQRSRLDTHQALAVITLSGQSSRAVTLLAHYSSEERDTDLAQSRGDDMESLPKSNAIRRWRHSSINASWAFVACLDTSHITSGALCILKNASWPSWRPASPSPLHVSNRLNHPAGSNRERERPWALAFLHGFILSIWRGSNYNVDSSELKMPTTER